jgi:hypothetical protein
MTSESSTRQPYSSTIPLACALWGEAIPSARNINGDWTKLATKGVGHLALGVGCSLTGGVSFWLHLSKWESSSFHLARAYTLRAFSTRSPQNIPRTEFRGHNPILCKKVTQASSTHNEFSKIFSVARCVGGRLAQIRPIWGHQIFGADKITDSLVQITRRTCVEIYSSDLPPITRHIKKQPCQESIVTWPHQSLKRTSVWLKQLSMMAVKPLTPPLLLVVPAACLPTILLSRIC